MQFAKLTCLLVSVIVATTPNPADYPALDVTPKINKTWTSNVLSGNTIPNIAVRKSPLPSADLTLGKTRCLKDNQYALTYDDGPTPDTPRLLDQLKKQGLKATFLVVGSRAISYPDILLRAYNEGHEIGIHTWSHPAGTMLTNDQIVAEIVWTAKAIKEVIGVTPRIFRPPCNSFSLFLRW